MKKILKVFGVFSIIIFLSFNSYSQATFTAVQNGNWDVGTTWGVTGCTTGCVAGVDFPGPLDQANTGGFLVVVNRPGLSCKDLLVDVNTPGFAVRFIAPSIFLIINGSLVGVDNSIPGFTFASPPISNLFLGLSTIIFTGSNIGDPNLVIFTEVVAYWNSLTPIFRATFNLTGTGVVDFIYNGLTFAADNLVFSNSLNIINGTLDATATFSEGINSQSIVIGANGTFRTAYNGPNQTEGWWHQSSRPNIFSISGTVEYYAGVDQNVYVIPDGYGNLKLNGGGTKTVVGTGGLDINGDFELGSAVLFADNGLPIRIGGDLVNNNSAWNPNVNMIFDGTANQTITGISSLTFNQDLIVTNQGGTVSLGGQNITLNGTLEVAENSNFSPGARNVTLNSNIIAQGNILAGTGGSTFFINSSTNISGSGAAFNNLQINSSSSLTGPAGQTFAVAGSFNNDGTFNANNGTVEFSGSSSQSITHSTNLEFRNMEINNATGAFVNVDDDIDMTGILSMTTTSSGFDADGSSDNSIFTLKSTSLNQDAQIGTIPQPNNFRGNVTIERYVNGVTDEATNWRYLAPPITNANVAMWQAVFPVTGNFSNPSTTSPETPIDNPAFPSIYYWDGGISPYWLFVGTGASTGATPLENGLGYSVYTYRTSDFLISYRGTIGKGSVNKTFTPNAWALLGNPYPSTIDWDNIVRPADLWSAFYIRQDDGSIASYSPTAGGSNHPLEDAWDGEISSGQSFWVYSDGATSLTLNENAKTTSPNYQFLREGEPLDLIRVTLNYGVQDDEILIRFANNVKDEFEPDQDAIKLRNGDYITEENKYSYINLSSYVVNPDSAMVISSIPFIDDCDKTVYLIIEDVSEGSHKLTFNNIDAFNLGYGITLIDNYADQRIDVDENTEYDFQVTSDSASFGDGRFEILFAADLVNRSYDFYTNVECSNSFANITVDNTVAGAVYEIVKNGEIIGDPVIAENDQIIIPVSKDNLVIGETVFDLNSTIGSCENFIQNAFVVNYDSIYQITEVKDGLACGIGQVILQATGAPANGYYHWYQNETDTEPIPNETQAELIIEDLAFTITYYVSAVNSIGCESTLRRAVNAVLSDVPTAVPTAEDTEAACVENTTVLSASGAPIDSRYAWYDADGNLFEDEIESTFETPVLTDTSTFYVAISNQLGCAGDRVSIEVPVIILEKPIVTEDNGVLSSSYPTANQWFRDGEIIESATNTTYDTQLEAGLYTVEYNNGTCTVLSDPVEIEGVTGLDDIEESDLINLFPNPASDHLYVEYNVQSQNKVRLLIYTNEGRLVDSEYMDIFKNGHKIALDITRYSKGMYITVVYDGENYVYSRFNKQ